MPSQRNLLLAIAVTCFALVGAAVYLQVAKDLLPCPLCILQRYAFVVAGIFSLVAAFARRPKIWAALGLAGALAGLGTVAKHLYVIANPGFSCGRDPLEAFLNKIPTADLMPLLFRADGLCENAGDAIAGLTIPQWSAVWFAIVTAALVYALVRRR